MECFEFGQFQLCAWWKVFVVGDLVAIEFKEGAKVSAVVVLLLRYGPESIAGLRRPGSACGNGTVGRNGLGIRSFGYNGGFVVDLLNDRLAEVDGLVRVGQAG